MKIDTKELRWVNAKLVFENEAGQVTLYASWRPDVLELIAVAAVCATLTTVFFFGGGWAFSQPAAAYWSAAASALFSLAMVAHFLRRWRRPKVPLMSIAGKDPIVVEDLISSTPEELDDAAELGARFASRTEWSPTRRFVLRAGESQVYSVDHEGYETTLLQFLEYKGLPDWMRQQRTCRALDVALKERG